MTRRGQELHKDKIYQGMGALYETLSTTKVHVQI